MKKRFLTVALSLVMGFGVAASLASCGEGEDKFKFGLICLHDETLLTRQGERLKKWDLMPISLS